MDNLRLNDDLNRYLFNDNLLNYDFGHDFNWHFMDNWNFNFFYDFNYHLMNYWLFNEHFFDYFLEICLGFNGFCLDGNFLNTG